MSAASQLLSSIRPVTPSARHAARGSGASRARTRFDIAVQRCGPTLRRSIDVTATFFGLLALAPLLLAAAFAIRITSRGSIFYRQERVGQHGRRFDMFKLRTMVSDADRMKTALASAQAGAESSVRFKMRRDPRVTAVGRVLRKFSVDELPQLYNVLRGDMTLVGPRPPVWREVALYDARALRRLEVRPGLTCLWQIGGRSDLSFEEQVELDLHYIDSTRAMEEIAIVAKTIPAVVSGRGAY